MVPRRIAGREQVDQDVPYVRQYPGIGQHPAECGGSAVAIIEQGQRQAGRAVAPPGGQQLGQCACDMRKNKRIRHHVLECIDGQRMPALQRDRQSRNACIRLGGQQLGQQVFDMGNNRRLDSSAPYARITM